MGDTTTLQNCAKEYLKRFNKKTTEERIPLSGGFDLTHRCNLKCLHCFLGDKTKSNSRQKKELNTSQWLKIIDDITQAGCLNLLITGGEPFIREDFPIIFRHAKENGLLVEIFTNGTMINDDVLALFKELPPHGIEISLYGATAETYEKISGVPGSYKKCLKGIEKLLDNKINLKLKTILMTVNNHEFFDIENMAKDFGVKFRFDPAILPCFDGDRTPITLRVEPEEAVKKELHDKKKALKWKEYFEKMQGITIPDKLYNCGSGQTTFHIDPYGHLQPCMMVSDIQYDLLNGSFIKGWEEVIPKVKERSGGKEFVCNKCEKMYLCSFCPGFFKVENGSEYIPSEYLCAMGQYRLNAINTMEKIINIEKLS